MDMRVPGGRGKRKRDGANQQIGMYQKETPAQRILQLQEALNKIHGEISVPLQKTCYNGAE